MIRRLLNILILIFLLAGIGLIAYPTVSDWLNRYRAEQALTENEQLISSMESSETAQLFRDAYTYNQILYASGSSGAHPLGDAFSGLDAASDQQYLSLLNVNGDGIMGSLLIPKIDLELPIYHTTGSNVLKKGIGHVEGSALPVGGPSTHCALAGHRGLPSARLFTDLDQMELGDLFFIQVLDRRLTYCVDQIVVVEPTESQYLNPEEGMDYVTLVTCTPYSINTHRLLVRGVRMDTDTIAVGQDAVFPFWLYGGTILVCSLVILLLIRKRKKVA